MSGRYHPAWDLITVVTDLSGEFYSVLSLSSHSSRLIAALTDLPDCVLIIAQRSVLPRAQKVLGWPTQDPREAHSVGHPKNLCANSSALA